MNELHDCVCLKREEHARTDVKKKLWSRIINKVMQNLHVYTQCISYCGPGFIMWGSHAGLSCKVQSRFEVCGSKTFHSQKVF